MSGHDRERKPKALVLRNAPLQRLEPMHPIHLREQIIGSRHRFPIDLPLNIDLEGGDARAEILLSGGTSMWLASSPTTRLNAYERVQADIDFAPKSPAAESAVLDVRVSWPDGHTEEQSAIVTASARGLDDVPSANRRHTSEEQPLPDPIKTGPVPAETDDAAYSVQNLTFKQQQGVTTVENEQFRFEAAKESAFSWLDLVELAILLGTAGLASLIGEAVETGLAGLAAREIAAEGAHEASRGAKAVAHAVEDAFKDVVGKSAKKVLEGGEGSEMSQRDETAISQDRTIGFFRKQHAVLSDIEDSFKRQLLVTSSQIERERPGQSAVAMRAVRNAIDAVASTDRATIVQANATAAQWVAYRARQELGAEKVGNEEATKLAVARVASHPLDVPGKVTGLLDIHVELAGDKIDVTGAEVRGIAQLVADRLLDVDLLASRMPLRIVIGHDMGFITCDELGRVRYAGLKHLDADSDRSAGELQEIREAERIANIVRARSLKQWGLEHITTNDASKQHA